MIALLHVIDLYRPVGERPKLQLKPRTVTDAPGDVQPATKSRSDPFGGAKPVDKKPEV